MGVLMTVAVVGACAAARLPDDRAYCLALEKRRASLCDRVRSADIRTNCIAEILRAPGLCVDVLDPAVREVCRLRSG